MPEFDPDDVIKLALANTSYGFGNFLRELYGNKKAKENQTLRLFSIHKSETGIDPFQVLQSTEKLEMVTDKEYKKRTGQSRLPRGTGRGTGGRPSKISETFGKGTTQAKDNQRNIPFPPQVFDWLNVVPLKEEENQYQGSEQYLLGFHLDLFDYALFFHYYDDKVLTINQISEKMGVPKNRIKNFISKFSEYEVEGVGIQWSNVLKHLWNIQTHRGKNHHEDEVMMELRGIFRDFVNDPVNTEAPTIEDIDWVYGKLLEEEQSEDFGPEVDLELEKTLVIIEASVMKKIKSSSLQRFILSDMDFSDIKIPNQLSEAKAFSTSIAVMSVKNQIMHEIYHFKRSRGTTAKTNLSNMLFAIEAELYRISEFDLNKLEFRTIHNEIAKIYNEFGQEPWFELGETIDWTDRDSLLRTLVNYAYELNNLQGEITTCLSE